MRVRAKTVTKTVHKTLPPVHSLDFSLPRDEEPVEPVAVTPTEPATETALEEAALTETALVEAALAETALIEADLVQADLVQAVLSEGAPEETEEVAATPHDEQQQIEVFLQVEEAVADEGLMAFRELPLEENVLEENPLEESLLEESLPEESMLEESMLEEGPEPLEIFVQEGEASTEAGLVILGMPGEAPTFAPEPSPEELPEAPAAQPVPPCPGKPYMVRRGDSFQLIARRFDVSVRTLLEANPELQPGRLMVGDVLCIPPAEPPAPTPVPAPAPHKGVHRVREGESIADILLAGDVSLSAFQTVNPGLRLGQQRVGDTVRMPEPGARGRCREGWPHRVAEGEDIAALAVRHSVTVGMLLRANPHLLPSDFGPGQVVCVPKKA